MPLGSAGREHQNYFCKRSRFTLRRQLLSQGKWYENTAMSLSLFWPALSFTPREFLVLTKPCLHPCDLTSKTPLSLSVLLASTLNPTANYNGSFPGPESPVGPFWFITIIKPSSLTISTPSPASVHSLKGHLFPPLQKFFQISQTSRALSPAPDDLTLHFTKNLEGITHQALSCFLCNSEEINAKSPPDSSPLLSIFLPPTLLPSEEKTSIMFTRLTLPVIHCTTYNSLLSTPSINLQSQLPFISSIFPCPV